MCPLYLYRHACRERTRGDSGRNNYLPGLPEFPTTLGAQIIIMLAFQCVFPFFPTCAVANFPSSPLLVIQRFFLSAICWSRRVRCMIAGIFGGGWKPQVDSHGLCCGWRGLYLGLFLVWMVDGCVVFSPLGCEGLLFWGTRISFLVLFCFLF